MVRNYSKAMGFVENSSESDDLQAWCHACEIKFESEGGEMTEAFRRFNAMALVCVDCYSSLKGFHSYAVV